MEQSLAVKYPFSSFAKKQLQATGMEVIDPNLLAEATNRIITSINAPNRKETARYSVPSYALSRLVLACLAKGGVTRKFALREARAAAQKLSEEEDSVFTQMAKELFPSLHESNGNYSILLTDFLKFGTNLPYAHLDKGKAFLDKTELINVLREAIAAKIGDLPRIKPSEVPPIVSDAVEELEQLLPKETMFGSFHGKYLGLSCVKKIRSGLEEGSRYYGSMALAIACLRDGLSMEEAKGVMGEYAANCRKATHPFTAREALSSMEWVYKHPSIRFSCKTLVENDLVKEYCEDCPHRRK